MSMIETYPQIKCPFKNSRGQTVYKEISFSSDYTLSSKSKANKWFLTFSGKVVQMVYATNEFIIFGKSLLEIGDYFIYPCSSRYLNIFQCSAIVKNVGNIEAFKKEEVKAKLICLLQPNGFVYIPLVHTLK